jgi:hypothetical protein
VAILIAVMLLPVATRAQESPRRVFSSLPLEFDYDFGADNGNALVNRYMPLLAFLVNEDWSVINMTLAGFADAPGGVPGQPGNPEPVPSDQNVFGLMDTANMTLFTRTRSLLHMGVGPAVTIPTATDDRLGSGKWLLGASLRLVYRPGHWNLGAVAANQWSVAGDADRAAVNQLIVRGTIRRKLPGDWYFVYAPIITANWNASSGEKWLVPVGGGLGRNLTLGTLPAALSVQAYSNVVRPDGAPKGMVRVALVVPVPRIRRGAGE